MKLNNLTLKEQGLFDRYLCSRRYELSAFSFVNIYIWRPFYRIQWCLIEGRLCVFFRDRLGFFLYLPPLGVKPSPDVIRRVFKEMDKFNKNRDISRIENIPAEELEYYRSLGYCCREKYPDYLCARQDLTFLKGNRFKPQRASCNYFIKHYDYECKKFMLADRKDCLELFDSWAAERRGRCEDGVYRGMLQDSRKVLRKAFGCYKNLGLEGIVVKVSGEIKAFSFGCRINKDTFCLLYEIADLSIKGLAQFIFRQFSRILESYRYINIMDDSGLENLRKTKLSYHPRRLVPAYIATRNE